MRDRVIFELAAHLVLSILNLKRVENCQGYILTFLSFFKLERNHFPYPLNIMMIRTLAKQFGTIKQFADLEILNKYLEVHKYPYVLVYFTAKWNPACKITDEHVNLISNSYNDFEIFKIDSDVSPKISKYYNVRAEPEFIFCLYGDEVIRQIGVNKDKLIEKCELML